jgi:hypothetical protein
MNHFPPTLNEIAEDHDEWSLDSPDTPLKQKNIRSVKIQVELKPMPGIKDHPVALPGVDDQRVAFKEKNTRRSTSPNKPNKVDKLRRDLANLEPAMVSPGPNLNERPPISLVNLDGHEINPTTLHQEISSVSPRKLRRSQIFN